MNARPFGVRAALAALAIAAIGALVAPVSAQTLQQRGFDPAKDVGIDQRLNEQIPLDARFRDETGKTITLGDYFNQGRPVLLNMIFYKCQGSCNVQLDSMQALLRDMKLNLGQDYTAVTISISPTEDPALAAEKKHEVTTQFQTPPADWHYLTGTEDQIKKVASAVGFRYVFDPKSGGYAHMVGLILLTPQGRISRYYLGVNYSPKDVRLSLVDASSNKIGTIADKVYLLCSDYDPTTGKYGVSVMKALRIAGLGTTLILGVFIALMVRIEKKRQPVPTSTGTASHPR